MSKSIKNSDTFGNLRTSILNMIIPREMTINKNPKEFGNIRDCNTLTTKLNIISICIN